MYRRKKKKYIIKVTPSRPPRLKQKKKMQNLPRLKELQRSERPLSSLQSRTSVLLLLLLFFFVSWAAGCLSVLLVFLCCLWPSRFSRKICTFLRHPVCSTRKPMCGKRYTPRMQIWHWNRRTSRIFVLEPHSYLCTKRINSRKRTDKRWWIRR